MAVAELESCCAENEAEALVERNWGANGEALGELRLDDKPPDLRWVFGRDGSLTARDAEGHWLSGCSLPRRAGETMLKDLRQGAGVACFLCPTHAAQLQVALGRLGAGQCVIALLETGEELAPILACADFAKAVSQHRLFFVAGEDWAERLEKLFIDFPGLPTPSTFIRPITLPQATAERLIPRAQAIFSRVAALRGEQIERLARLPRQAKGSGKTRVCLVAPSQFRLWDDGGQAMTQALKSIGPQIEMVNVDPDDPASSSPLIVAQGASQSDALLAVNFLRADSPDVLTREMPWITWLTRPRILAFSSAGPGDRLMLADSAWVDLAMQRGWPRSAVHVARWPALCTNQAPPSGPLTIIADTMPVAPCTERFDLSSLNLLWEFIYSELSREPLALGGDVESYLEKRAGKLGIALEQLDCACFIDELMVPMYQQGVARALIRSNRRPRIWGKGWEHIEEFSKYSVGPILERAQFQRAVDESAALVHVWPMAHAVETAGRPIVRAGSHRQEPAVASDLLSGPLLARVLGV